MLRRFDEPIEVRVEDEPVDGQAPEHRGPSSGAVGVYAVRGIDGHWSERRAWWRGPGPGLGIGRSGGPGQPAAARPRSSPNSARTGRPRPTPQGPPRHPRLKGDRHDHQHPGSRRARPRLPLGGVCRGVRHRTPPRRPDRGAAGRGSRRRRAGPARPILLARPGEPVGPARPTHPELSEWARHFAVITRRMPLVESGRIRVSVREADDLLRDAEAFLARAELVIGLPAWLIPRPGSRRSARHDRHDQHDRLHRALRRSKCGDRRTTYCDVAQNDAALTAT